MGIQGKKIRFGTCAKSKIAVPAPIIKGRYL